MSARKLKPGRTALLQVPIEELTILQFGPRGVYIKLDESGDEHLVGHLPVLLKAAHTLQRAIRIAADEAGFDDEEVKAAMIGVELLIGLGAVCAERADNLETAALGATTRKAGGAP